MVIRLHPSEMLVELGQLGATICSPDGISRDRHSCGLLTKEETVAAGT